VSDEKTTLHLNAAAYRLTAVSRDEHKEDQKEQEK
jgi:hypothetical protein